MQEESFIELSLLNQLVREVIEGNFMEDIWVVAEISEVRLAASGHCYLELVEKKGEKVVARMKANIWNYQYQRVQTNFYSVTGKELARGMKVLLLASVSFHELFGMSLVVKDVNPEFTLGDLEKNKREVLQRLKKEGLLEKNKQLELAIVPKRIAVVSSKTAAGYEDFLNQIKELNYKYHFEIEFFEALMQGDQVGQSVISALKMIAARKDDFDSVAIIRGGGASLDLAGFDDYNLAREVANFPLPVLSGIGHERDRSILDEVVHTKLKTPTAVAAFYIQQFDEFAEYLNDLKDALVNLVKEKMFIEKDRFNRYRSNFALISRKFINLRDKELSSISASYQRSAGELLQLRKGQLSTFQKVLKQSVINGLKNERMDLKIKRDALFKVSKNLLKNQHFQLEFKQKQIKLLDPVQVLQRGFAMVQRLDGSFVKGVSVLNSGESLNVIMKDGAVEVKTKQDE